MPTDFLDDVLSRRSVSVVGLAKHAGKTECLNYILRGAAMHGARIAATSIGVDGEKHDVISSIPKPEIVLSEGMVFVTSKAHYEQKRLVAEVLDVSGRSTALGKLIVARAKTKGKVILSGPADTDTLGELVGQLAGFGVDTVLVDGALSRLSPASPAVTEAMVLATGAAVSTDMATLLEATKFTCDLVGIEAVADDVRAKLLPHTKGLWALDDGGNVRELGITSALALKETPDDIFRHGKTIYAAGAVNDALLDKMVKQPGATLIARDFTKITAGRKAYGNFIKKGGAIKVLLRSKLLAVCVNPVSPTGFRYDSGELQQKLRQALGVPVYDIMGK